MKVLADTTERLRALTELESTLLVEAAAGTGKTALMAARITYLLAEGGQPESVAAITFTELAASALAERVHHYIDELLSGECPKPLAAALPRGLSEQQKTKLKSAALRLNELTVSTIHAFCQTIISSYAVEADIDPGAQILDADQAGSAFDRIFERWLKGRLNCPIRGDDPIATLSKDEPRRIVETLHKLGKFRREHRSANTVRADLSGRPDVDLIDAVIDFRRWFSSQLPEPKTEELIADLEALGNFYADSFKVLPDFEHLWELAHPPRVASMRGRESLELKTPRLKTAWRKVAKEEAPVLEEEMLQHFDEVNRRYRTILGRIATALVGILSAELDEVLREYETFKHDAAVLDFDDLLLRARELLRSHEDVRVALGRRYKHIFVDEFQDTDPVQSEILFQIAAERRAEKWENNELRPGSLFMVGDPKQSIYRFRRADIGSYAEIRDTIRRRWPNNVIQITANFRSRPGILEHVNKCFESPLSKEGQPGYVPLTSTLENPEHDLPCVSKLIVDAGREPRANDIRDAEAETVADACARLIGNLIVEDTDGTKRPLRAGDIALLTPSWTQLWRYERALEEKGLSVASQAGKGLFRRQETQDLLALARVLADGRDTLAFGAFMRGPLVGLTEDELLDIAEGLPRDDISKDLRPRFDLYTKIADVPHAHAREVLSIIQDIRYRARSTTPALLLAEAIERLRVRAILRLREPQFAGRAIANVEAFLERARPYGVRGLKYFVQDLTRDWKSGAASNEGEQDGDEDAIKLITVHSAKGLEWPVVIPINTATGQRPLDPYVHRMSDDTLHWLLGEIAPPELAAALEEDSHRSRLEQERLWYVACTRARELLVLPHIPEASSQSWAKLIDLKLGDLLAPKLTALKARPAKKAPELENRQTAEIFAAERSMIDVVSIPLTWVRPSSDDGDRYPLKESITAEPSDAPETALPIGAGRVRGLVLHKLMEELLTGELSEDTAAVETRAAILIQELANDIESDGTLPEQNEVAETAIRTLRLPEIIKLRPTLVPEWPVYGLLGDRSALAGRLDAATVEEGRVRIVVDWKSDVDPSEAEMARHTRQILDYLVVTKADRGALVYMTGGRVRWIDRRTSR